MGKLELNVHNFAVIVELIVAMVMTEESTFSSDFGAMRISLDIVVCIYLYLIPFRIAAKQKRAHF